MSPQALLFSSDGEASRQLRQALYELEFEVEHCPEIFAAVEKLTGKNFDVIVSDFDDGLEASFLLKTSRDIAVQPLLRTWLERIGLPGSVRLQIDVDPYSFL